MAVESDRFSVVRGADSVSLAAVGTGNGEWKHFEDGVTRTAPFGSETVVVDGEKVEQFLTVEERQGTRTWRWKLQAGGLTPRLGDDGTVGVHADLVRELFLQDCDEATVQQALDRLTRQSAMPFAQPPLHIAWQEKPSTYFVCTEDLAIPAELQRQRAGGGARLIDFPSGHHPFLSQPEAFAHSIAADIDSLA